eukprot:CAMPEP_0178756438 /NCGR_PEP_ID=MMETSP0744-20121128/13275_1 /TAXON_ID=913974 /ORGANISM="Nitzschia punctata, Strain CCMP561" /LENGTH=258 /DNA_ID=CAMNT_0020410581 /DNA_START=47 /DNA_END=820 /DNA_ORIENTATION=+
MMQTTTDERLSVENPAIKIPLDEISFSTGGPENNDEESVISTISNDEDSEENSQEQRIVDSVPRSIFSNYWKVDPKAAAATAVSADHHHQTSIRANMTVATPDPYKYFGIQHPNEVEEEKVEEDSVNTYERMLKQYEQQHQQCSTNSSSTRRPYESRPLWMSFFGGNCYSSEPQLQLQSSHIHKTGAIIGTRRNVQSDTALLKTPQKSCLRRGRFSASSCQQDDDASSHNKVSFQPKIQVHVFQPPVEKWAPSGWSDW